MEGDLKSRWYNLGISAVAESIISHVSKGNK